MPFRGRPQSWYRDPSPDLKASANRCETTGCYSRSCLRDRVVGFGIYAEPYAIARLIDATGDAWFVGFVPQLSTAVWVGYVACFGLATETGIVMMVYLREAIDRRGGMGKIRSAEQIREAVMEGAVARLRPKLLTEGTMILALIPMLCRRAWDRNS